MTEKSYFWEGLDVGDATALNPISADVFRQIFRDIMVYDNTKTGIVAGSNIGEGLRCTQLSPTSVQVNAGSALVNGVFYHSDAAIQYNISRPTSGTYYYTIILRANIPGQTVRQAILGPSTIGWQTLTQDSNVYEVGIARVSSTSGYIVTIYRNRQAITLNGMQEIKFVKRQGGASGNWNTAGVTAYTPDYMTRIQFGTKRWTGAGAKSGNVAVTFPYSFQYIPIAFASCVEPDPNSVTSVFTTTIVPTASGLTIYWSAQSSSPNITTLDIFWMAVGPLAL